MSTFTCVNDDVLCSRIEQARRKVVFIAPGVSLRLAEALGNRFRDADTLDVVMIIDTDPEVCRLGYGSIEGLKKLSELAAEHHLELRRHSGLRIGVLIADDQTLVFSPVPLLVEAGSTEPTKPNGIVIGSEPSATIETAAGATKDTLPAQAEIGAHAVTPHDVATTADELRLRPPKQFDIARVERVFTSLMQYVEFNVEHYRLESKTISVPTELMGLADNRELQDRWRNTFKVLDSADSVELDVPELDEEGDEVIANGAPRLESYRLSYVERDRKRLIKDYLNVVPNYDTVILRARRAEFDKAVARFEKRLHHFSEAVAAKFEELLQESLTRLTEYLVPRAMANPPVEFRKRMLAEKPDEKSLREFVIVALRRAVGISNWAFHPKVTVKYKDVTYESIKDPSFRTALERVFGEAVTQKLFNEFDAAPETARVKRKDS